LNVLEIEDENYEAQENQLAPKKTLILKIRPDQKDEEGSDQDSPKKTSTVGKSSPKDPSPLKGKEAGTVDEKKFTSSCPSYSDVLKK